ncbi:MAG TPA: hypothetical protein VFM10_12870 [Terriglobales bacterium]|nr:hypothetical protein [Terriglobales bacterium]
MSNENNAPEGLPSLGEILGQLAGAKPAPSELLAATREQALVLIEGSREIFAVGDVVKLRPEFEKSIRYPAAGQEVIVTQVLLEPVRGGRHGTPSEADPKNIAICMVDPEDGQLVEFLHDSRKFVKVGSILN